MTTDKNFFLPQGGVKPCRIRPQERGAESDFFSEKTYIPTALFSAFNHTGNGQEFHKPYFTAISFCGEHFQDFESCTFDAVPACIRSAGFDRALAEEQKFTAHTQTEIATRIQDVSRTLFINQAKRYEKNEIISFKYKPVGLYLHKNQSRRAVSRQHRFQFQIYVEA